MIDIALLLLCIKVFIARILDVSLGTIRVMLISKGQSVSAFFIAFVEVFIWFLVARDVLTNDVNIIVGVAYALGYATGTFVGITLTNKFSKGNFSVQVITSKQDIEMIDKLRSEGYAVSVSEVRGKDEKPKYMLFIEINKKNLTHLKEMVKDLDKNAFIVVNETKFVQNGYIK